MTPRLAIFNSFAGFGRISITAALPVCAALNVQACPAPTAVLSSHLACKPCFLSDCTEMLPSYVAAWEKLGLTFDGVQIGYVRSAAQLQTIRSFLCSHCITDHTLFVVDPVMGDHGRPYATITPEHIERMKDFAQLAHILTPNITEACLLTDSPMKETDYTEKELLTLCRRLDPLLEKNIVITGIRQNQQLTNCIWEKGALSLLTVPAAENSRPGAGDIFSSIVTSVSLHGLPFSAGVKKAADFISQCMRDSDAENIPINDGILFEQSLKLLKLNSYRSL